MLLCRRFQMDKNIILEAIKKARENSKKRKFSQSFDLIVNLKNINLKKAGDSVDTFLTLPFGRGKKIRVCALVDAQLAKQAKEICDKIILLEDFNKYQDKKILKELSREFDFFIGQADLMSKIATTFGKVLGTAGKMPNPKAGCIVPGNANLKLLYEKLQKTVRMQTKNEAIIKCIIGNENMKDEDVAENILFAYNSLLHSLPQEKNNLKEALLKSTMGKPIALEDKK